MLSYDVDFKDLVTLSMTELRQMKQEQDAEIERLSLMISELNVEFERDSIDVVHNNMISKLADMMLEMRIKI